MAIIATDWADFYGGRQENFLMQQMRNLANPGNGSVARGSPLEPKTDPATRHLVGTDRHYVTQDRVGDRVRFHLHRAPGKVPLPALPTASLPWGWAEDFAHKPESFLADMVRRVHYAGSSAAVAASYFGEYRVEVSNVDGRVRYDLRAVDAQTNIFD